MSSSLGYSHVLMVLFIYFWLKLRFELVLGVCACCGILGFRYDTIVYVYDYVLCYVLMVIVCAIVIIIVEYAHEFIYIISTNYYHLHSIQY